MFFKINFRKNPMFKMENSLYKAQIRGIFKIPMIQFEVAATFGFAQEYSTGGGVQQQAAAPPHASSIEYDDPTPSP